MRARPRTELAAALALALCSASCGRVGHERLVELEPPVLDRMDSAVRAELEQAYAAAVALARQPDADKRALGGLYGQLGRLYHAYELHEAALPCYRNAELLLPGDARWPYYLGHVWRALHRPDAAREAFERALALAPGDGPTLLALAQLERELGHADIAVRRAGELLARDPGAAGAVLLLAETAVDRGDWGAAVEAYERLLRLQPGATRMHQPLALAYRALGRLDEARQQLALRGEGPVSIADRWMEELRSLGSGARHDMDLGVAAYGRGDFAGAVAAFRRAVDSDPSLVGARVNLGSALFRVGQDQQAAEQFDAVLTLDPNHALAHFNLGVILARQGKIDDSIRHYEQALRTDPDYPNPRFNLANALRHSGRCASAVGHYRRLVELDPGNGSARVGETLCLVDLGRIDEARARLEEGLRLLPGDRTLVHATARILATCPAARMRNGRRALEIAERLVAAERTPDSLATLAMALAETGRFEEAVRRQREALDAAGASGRAELLPLLRENLARYERREPCRDRTAAG